MNNNYLLDFKLKKITKNLLSLPVLSSIALPLLFSSQAFSAAPLIYDKEGMVISSDMTSDGSMLIGSYNDGALTINNGAVVDFSGNYGVNVGYGLGVSGALTVTGNGTHLITENSLTAGHKGSGEINILDGAQVTLNKGQVYIGGTETYAGQGGLKGAIAVSGTGSSLTTSREIAVGYSSEGHLLVSDGGHVSTVDTLYIGRGSSSNSPNAQYAKGYVYVTGSGSRIDAERVLVGTYGSGSLLIADGAVVNSTAGNNTIAYDKFADKSTVVVTGTNSLWSTQHDLSVGYEGDGELTVTDSGKVSANTIYIGRLTDSVGTLNIGSAANQAAAAAGHLDSPTIQFGFGDGTLVLNHTDSDYLLSSLISGEGKVEVYHGTTVLTAANSYSGTTTLYGGTLAAGAENALSSASTYQINQNATLDLRGFNQTLATLDNRGTVNFGGLGGTTFTIAGDYSGHNGLITFNAILNGDDSIVDRLMINGDTSGSSRVSVNNLGGSGAQTLDGIELITVSGTSNGEFIQDGRIVAGAYEYVLDRGQGADASNWYLNSSIKATSGDEHIRRPEAASYTANLSAANALFATSLHDRLGETQYVDALTGETRVTSLWMRNEGGHNRWRDSSGQLSTQSNRYVLQLGGDIAQWSTNHQDRWHLGLMAGYANSSSNTDSQASGYRARGSVSGYSIGLYGTWYANNEDKSGLYVDSWAQYGWFNNRVNGEGLGQEKYDSSGVTASVETGYTFKTGEKGRVSYFIQPKAQAVWMGVKADYHTESNGTRISGKGDGNIQTRLGVKAYLQGHSQIDDGKDREFQPFAEVNWIHNSRSFASKMDGVTVKQDGARNSVELKLGLETQLSRKLNGWVNVAHQVGEKEYSDTAAMLGIKYNF